MKGRPKFKICAAQGEILSLKFENLLFNSLIENKIEFIKYAKIEKDSKEERHCKFLMCWVNNLNEECRFEKVPRDREATIEWVYFQIFRALPRKKFASFWPSKEMIRSLLEEICKTQACQSAVFMNLVKLIYFFVK